MNTGQSIRFAWRFARRELLSGELTVLLLALALAVSALSSVAFFADRIERALNAQASQLMAADLVMSDNHPADAAIRQHAASLGLNTADSAGFPSMTFANEQAQLATFKAVTDNYPLRGKVTLKLSNGQIQADATAPVPGTAWADERLLRSLHLKLGDSLLAGEKSLRIVAIIIKEPDATLDLYRFVPRLLFNAADLPATGLVQEGSRIRYRLMFAGDPSAIRSMQSWLSERLPKGARLENIEEARPEIRTALERARRFLGLTALLTVVLGAAAVGLAVRRYLARHWQPVAVLRCLGLTGGEVCTVFAQLFVVLALAAGAIGTLIGYGIQQALLAVAQGWFDAALPSAGLVSWLMGPFAALILLFGLALPPLAAIRRIPALAVLRTELPPGKPLLWAPLPTLAALLGLTAWQLGDMTLGLFWAGGLIGFLLIVAALAWWLLHTARQLPAGGRIGWRHGLASLARRPWLSVVQLVALAVSLMALLTLTVVRTDLMQAWQRSIPPDAPNQFVLNIQPEQRNDVLDEFQKQGLISPELSPMVRGRLTTINGQPVQPERYEDERAQRLSEREFNLSWRDTLPEGNRLTAGDWWTADSKTPQFSVEKGLAETLGIRMGDTLTFDVAGTTFSARVTSLRDVSWDSFQVNFFVIAPSGWMEDQPASYITSFRLPEGRATAIDHLIARFPNLTIIDVSMILDEVRSVVDKLAKAIEGMFILSLLAGVLVLWAALTTTRDERLYDAGLLRTLGASRSQLSRIFLSELAWLGALSGLLAGLGAMALGALAAAQLFNLPLVINWTLPLIGMVSGVALVVLSGWPLLRRVVRTEPMRVLRSVH